MPDEAATGPDSTTADEREHEQQYVTLLYDRLDGLRRYAQSRLAAVLLNTGGTPQARSERESFTQMYTEDIAKYDAAENGLCFGRIDLDPDALEPGAAEGDARRYIGRVGMTGLATGPHLHYEMLQRGTQINPLNLQLPSGDPIPATAMDRWSGALVQRLALLEVLPGPDDVRFASHIAGARPNSAMTAQTLPDSTRIGP